MTDPNKYMTLKEAADTYPFGSRLTHSILWRWCKVGKNGHFLAHIPGKPILVRHGAIDDFLQRLERTEEQAQEDQLERLRRRL